MCINIHFNDILQLPRGDEFVGRNVFTGLQFVGRNVFTGLQFVGRNVFTGLQFA